MEPQAPVSGLHLNKETRTDTRNPLGSIIQIQISQPSAFAVRQRQTRQILRATHAFDSPDAYRKHYFATSASIFHSQGSKFPRSVLWRVVQDQKVLELRFVDLTKDVQESKDARYTIQLFFGGQLRRGGIALTDTDDPNVVNVFALTKSNELYTIALRKDFFSSLKASEDDTVKWYKIIKPATFSISAPHSLVAASPSQLIVSLSDGRLLRLTKNRGEDGSRWNESIYGDGHWTSSLRGLVRWQGSNTIRHDGNTLEQTTLLSMAVSPDDKHVFAISMNHTLRIWNLSTGLVVFSQDMLDQEREQHELPRHLLDPNNSSYLQMLKLSGSSRGYKYCALVFSSHDLGEFKFWGVRDPDFGENGVQDAFPESRFHPPDPDPITDSKSMWKVADSKIQSGQSDGDIVLWVLMQSSRRYKLYSLQCEFHDLASQWNSKWVCVAMYSNKDGDTPLMTPEANIEEEWLDYILRPPRYPEAVVESALQIYRMGCQMDSGDHRTPLKERMCTAIEHQVKRNTIGSNVEDLRLAVYQEWKALWQDIQDLHHSGSNALSLSVDSRTNMPWTILSDGCSVVRSCTRLEQISSNRPDVLAVSHERIEMPSVETEMDVEPKLPDELAVVIEAAANLRKSFGAQLQQNFRAALSEELWGESNFDMPNRLEEFSKRCNFEEELGDNLLNDLDIGLEQIEGLQNLDRDAFFAITDSFPSMISDTPSDLSYSKFGIRTLINAAREMIYHRESILSDLVACTAIATTEVDHSETRMQYFDGPQIFTRLLELLKQYQVMRWLVDHTNIDWDNERVRRREMVSPGEPYIDWKPTILESLFAGDLTPQSAESQTHCDAFTHSVEDLLQWTMGGNKKIPLHDITAHIQCNLLKHKNIGLASDFLRFQFSTPWATYVKGRLFLLKGQPEEAATCFQQAGPGLAKFDEHVNEYALKDLLSRREIEHLDDGLSNYFSHIIDLFTDVIPSCPVQAAHFANLALKKLPDQASSDQSTPLLESLFNASLQIGDFNTAHSALTRHSSPESHLPNLITKMLLTPNTTSKIFSFTWPPPLHRHIDLLLSKQAKPKTLAAWRLHHDDFRGAAAALLPSLNALQARVRRSAVDEEQLENEYLTIINLLECVGKRNAWILSGGSSDTGNGSREKRKVVTVADLRCAYQKELDRRSVIDRGGYAFANGHDDVNGDEMDLL